MSQQCGVLDATPGLAVVVGAPALAFVLYLCIYSINCCVGRHSRSVLVFVLDMTKIAIGIACMVGMHVLVLTAQRDHLQGFDELSWYLVTSLVVDFVAVPLAVLTALLLLLIARSFMRCGIRAFEGIEYFGRYKPDAVDQQTLIGSGASNSERASWWFAQLLVWVGCLAAAVYGTGFLVPILEQQMGNESPFHKLADKVYDLDWTCGRKLWLLAGAARAASAFVMAVLFVDVCNRPPANGARRATGPRNGVPLLQPHSRVRALWKYNAQYEDELSFEAGDVITIEGEAAGEELWYRGKIGNRTGLIPSNYVINHDAQ